MDAGAVEVCCDGGVDGEEIWGGEGDVEVAALEGRGVVLALLLGVLVGGRQGFGIDPGDWGLGRGMRGGRLTLTMVFRSPITNA